MRADHIARLHVRLATIAVVSIAAGLAHAQDRGGAAPVPAALIEAARAEGSLSLYASISEGQIKAFLAAFEAQYGIKGSYLRLVSSPLVQRFVTENDAGSNAADAVIDSTPEVFDQHASMFAPLDQKAWPNLAKWPAKWTTVDMVILQTSPVVLQYNTDIVPREAVPKTWAEVIDPKWKGKIVLTDPRISDSYLGWVDAVERRLGAPFLEELGAQDLKLTQSGAAGAQLVAAGAYAMNFPALASFAVPLIEKHAPIDTAALADPLLVNEVNVAVVAHAPHPNAARLFLDWLTSEEALRTICKAFQISTPGDPDGKLGCVPVKEPQALAYNIADSRRLQLLQELGLSSR